MPSKANSHKYCAGGSPSKSGRPADFTLPLHNINQPANAHAYTTNYHGDYAINYRDE
jgi:hypothetical protein